MEYLWQVSDWSICLVLQAKCNRLPRSWPMRLAAWPLHTSQCSTRWALHDRMNGVFLCYIVSSGVLLHQSCQGRVVSVVSILH